MMIESHPMQNPNSLVLISLRTIEKKNPSLYRKEGVIQASRSEAEVLVPETLDAAAGRA
jgi:hypothetical protein